MATMMHTVMQAKLQNLQNYRPTFSITKKPRKIARQNSRLAWDSRVTAPFIKLDLILECRRLPKKDSFSDCDAFCGIWEAPTGFNVHDKKVSRLPSRQEREIGRTEVVRENKNPKFTTTFRLDYKFQEEQIYVVRVYDEDLRYATDLKEHDYIGGCVFTLGELVGSSGNSIAKPLHQGKAFVVLTGQEIIETREVLEFRFSGQDLGLLERKNKNIQVAKDVLDKMDKLNVAKTVLEKFDSYFRLEKLNAEDQSWSVVWKSEVIKDNQNPTWNVARIPLQLLCSDDPSNPLKITIWVWNRFTTDDLVGSVETAVNELVHKAKRGIPVFDVMHEKKTFFGGTKLKKAGILKVLKAGILQIPSMLQYISGGCEMDLMVAVDCTAINGDWREENSLHYHSATWLNDYQVTMYKIGTIFDAYEGRREYTMWGYGARLMNDNGPTSSQAYFPMGEHIRGAEDLVKAYDKVFAADNINNLQLGETAELRHVIQAAMYKAIRSCQTKQCYSTLVILTAGAIDDLQESIDVACAAAEDAPLSIVVIAIGGGNFERIQKLAGDESGKLRHSNGVPVARDIVHFVAMDDFNGHARDCVAEALSQVPEQFVQHFTNSGIKPKAPKAVPDFSREQVFSKKAGGREGVARTKSSESSKSRSKSPKRVSRTRSPKRTSRQ